MKKTTITLEKDDVALVFTPDYSVNLYLPQTEDDEPISGTVLVAVALADLINKGDKKFTGFIIASIDRIVKLLEEDDGS